MTMSELDRAQLEAEIQQTDEAIGTAAPEPETDTAEQAGAGEQPQPTQLSNEQTVTAGLTAAVAMLSPMFPTLKQVYTKETIQAVADVTAPLANKYGVNLGGALAKYGEEIAFASVMIPLGISTYAAVLHDIEARQKAANDDAEEESKPVNKLEPVTDAG